MSKELINLSFSGGRTSAYMVYKMVTEMSDQYEFVVTFANTGLEHPKTLEFVHKCDIFFGFNTIWLEAVVHHGQRKGTGYKIVTYETASRNGEPFEEVIKKYGIPNMNYPHCTREMKLQPMRAYLKDKGYDNIPVAIGIRDDESRRVSVQAVANNIVYPLVDMFPTDKIEVLDFWKTQPFDLDIEEFEGNCLGCFKKSQKKQFMQIEKNPAAFDFFKRMEEKYPSEDRVFFRGRLDTKGLFRMYEELKGIDLPESVNYENGGCSESCELYDMEG